MVRYILIFLFAVISLTACRQSTKTDEKTITQLKQLSRIKPEEKLPQQTTKIKGEGFVKTKGKSIIYIPKGAIMDSSGKTYEGTFEVKVREALTMNDFVQSGLNTLSDKGILESGGMMQILVQDTAGKALKINPERGLRLSMPVNSPAQPMNPFRKVALKKEQDTLRKGWQLFYGAKDENGKMIWKEVEQPKKVLSVKEYRNMYAFSKLVEFIQTFEELKKNKTATSFYKLDQLKNHMFDYRTARNTFYRNQSIHMCDFFDLRSYIDMEELPNYEYPAIETHEAETTLECTYMTPCFLCDGRIFVVLEDAGRRYQAKRNAKKIKNKNILPICIQYPKRTDTIPLFDFTNSYNRIKKVYDELKDDQAFQEKLKAFEKEEAKTARLEAVIYQTGWYNCDRYTQEERFAGTFEVEGCDPELEPYLRLAWVQPDLNINIHPNQKQFPNYEFTGVKKSGGVLVAWIPGLMVGSLAVKPEQVQQGQANNPIPVGKLVLQPADDKKINALIEQLSRPVAIAERQRGK